MANNKTSKKIILKSSDGEEFEVPEVVAKVSPTICQIIKDGSDGGFIPLPDVTATTLAMVIEYCEKHVKAADLSKTETTEEGSTSAHTTSKMSLEELKNWDRQFVDVDLTTLYDLLMAGRYLKLEGLLDLAGQKVASIIEGKSTEEIR